MLQTAPNTTAAEGHDLQPSKVDVVASARDAQQFWRDVPVGDRLKVISACRGNLVDDPRAWAAEITDSRIRTLADSLAAEVLPLADACRFLERNAKRLLREAKVSGSDRPIWGRGLRVRVRRAPRGVVLVIGAGNYPLFLAGVQTLQALAAGNAVLIKPPPGGAASMHRLAEVLKKAGTPPGLVQALDESPAAAQSAIATGVDYIVLTGSAATGRAVLALAAQTLTPAAMELSGCDAVFVLPGADLDRVAAAVAFGLRLNGGATCIGPRRLFVPSDLADAFVARLKVQLAALTPVALPPAIAGQAERLVTEAIDAGAHPLNQRPKFDADAFSPVVLDAASADLPLLKADLFAPVASIVRVADAEEALRLDRLCPYALGAAVFGPPGEADHFAERVEAGCVTVNDHVAPTADPRVAFGGRGESGYGVTRGGEGLLAMTQPQTIITQTARWLPHLDPPREKLDQLIIGLLRLSHGRGLDEKWRGLRDVIAGARSRLLTAKDTKGTKE